MTPIDPSQNIIHSQDNQIIIKKCFTFFSPSIRMSGKSIILETKKLTKVISTKTKKYLR